MSTNRKQDFMKELNLSYRTACLHCSLSDKELNEYVQEKKRSFPDLPMKKAVTHVGRQEDDTWVLGENCYISAKGLEIRLESSNHIWIGHLYQGVGVAATSPCRIRLPLSNDPLKNLLISLRGMFQHNYIPALLLIAGELKK